METKNIPNIGTILLLLLSFLAMFSCNSRTIKGSGNVSSETREISNFNSVEVNSALKVIYTEGNEYRIEVVADDNLVKYITTERHGDELQIGIQSKKSFKNITKAEVHITAPSVNSIEANGASRFESIGVVHANTLSLKLSGASKANVAVQSTSLRTDLSGASTAVISGTTNGISMEGSGASVYQAKDLTVSSAAITLSGASNAALTVQNTLTATISGASNLDYYGNPPTVNVNSSGASNANQK